MMETMASDASWDATLTLLRWRQTRRNYDNDDTLLSTAFTLLAPDATGAFGPDSRLRCAEACTNIPADRIVTELIHLALLLITKPRHNSQSRGVLQLLYYGLRARRATAPAGDGSLSIPLNACNMLLTAMAETLENTTDAVGDVFQIFVFLFSMASSNETLATPSFHMYKPPTNVFSAFMQRACTAIFKQLTVSPEHPRERVMLLLAIFRVFQELQNSQVNKKKVFTVIAKTSYREIVGFRHALLELKDKVDGIAQVLDVLDHILVDALFDSEHLRAYDGAFGHLGLWSPQEDEDNSTPKKRKKTATKHESSLVSYQRHLFDELEAFLSDESVAADAKASIGSLLELLVRGYSTRIRAAANDKIEDTRADLKSSKKRVANVIATTSTAYSPFKFWAELCGVAFAAFTTVQQVELLVQVYDSLFFALCEADVYRVTEDTEEQEQFSMMQTILSRFIELLRNGEASLDESTMRHACHVISSAVRCTPNLVNSSLVSILQVLGACSCVIEAASASMVEMLHAYESMRLVDTFLRACCSTDDDDVTVSAGLLTVFSHLDAEATLRRTYMTLPPGQLEIVWRLLTDKLAVLCGSRNPNAIAAKMALVRSLFALFLQEIHITPQNRTKVGDLVKDSHEKLLAPLVTRVSRFQGTTKSKKKKGTESQAFSIVERELFSVFGEFLALYDGLVPTVRSETLDIVLTALDPHFVAVMASLLEGNDDHIVGAATGIVKIGVHRLRRKADNDNAVHIASLIVDRVIQWRCWDAVAFYLPELVHDLDEDKAAAMYVQLVQSYLGQDSAQDAAQRILRDAAFYEITVLQRVAAQVFTTVITRNDFVADHTRVRRLFEYLVAIPMGYLDTSTSVSGDLLVAVLQTHQHIAKDKNVEDTDTLTCLALWIEKYLIVIARENKAIAICTGLSTWIKFSLLDAITFDCSSARLVYVAIEYVTTLSNDDMKPNTAINKALTLLLTQTTARGYETSATVLHAIARIQEKHKAVVMHPSVTNFVKTLLKTIETSPSMIASLELDTSFQLLTALVRYTASLPDHTSPTRATLVALLETYLPNALAVAMQTLVQSTTTSPSRFAFFTTFCETFFLLRPMVTLETFGCLLAVALVLATESSHRPLACLVQHANKDEFRLLIATIERELIVPNATRVTAALKALVFVLETDKKLSNTRRQVLSEAKTQLVAQFIQLFSQSLTSGDTSLSVWTLRVFVLFYCKAELFTWKPHELLQVFAGFQPLTVIAKTDSAWTPAQIHDVWLLSYNLLLRIVRHHFASLIHGIPHMIDALNVLLRVLVAASPRTEMTAYTLEWSSNLARLYGYLKPQDGALRKHVVYLLLTYLHGVTKGNLSLALQQKLRPGVFALLEICSLFEKEQLYASLDSTGKSLLKSLDTSYKLTYRYAGKV